MAQALLAKLAAGEPLKLDAAERARIAEETSLSVDKIERFEIYVKLERKYTPETHKDVQAYLQHCCNAKQGTDPMDNFRFTVFFVTCFGLPPEAKLPEAIVAPLEKFGLVSVMGAYNAAMKQHVLIVRMKHQIVQHRLRKIFEDLEGVWAIKIDTLGKSNRDYYNWCLQVAGYGEKKGWVRIPNIGHPVVCTSCGHTRLMTRKANTSSENPDFKENKRAKYDLDEQIDCIQKNTDLEVSEGTMELIESVANFSEEVLMALDAVQYADDELRLGAGELLPPSLHNDAESCLAGGCAEKKMGYVYAAWNPLFPELIKIGATRADNPFQRIKQLSMTSVPKQFELVACVPSWEPFDLERKLHLKLDGVRCRDPQSSAREFFFITKEKVAEIFAAEVQDILAFNG